MACHSHQKKQTRGPLIEEGRQIEADANTFGKCYIVVRGKMQHGELFHLAQFLRQSGKPLNLVPYMTTDNRKLKKRIVKIVVTTEELELLLSGSKKFQIKSGVTPVRESSGLPRCPKWLPSLPTIQEVQNF